MTDPLSVAALSRTAPRVKFRPAQFHIVASQLPCVGRKLRPQQAWVHSVGNRGCIYWPLAIFRAIRAALSHRRYRPELHYMRGPGPKWFERHGR